MQRVYPNLGYTLLQFDSIYWGAANNYFPSNILLSSPSSLSNRQRRAWMTNSSNVSWSVRKRKAAKARPADEIAKGRG